MHDEFDAKWIALRSRFLARLPERMTDVELRWADCASGNPKDALKTLFHIAHNLSGSAATFGFDELARAAQKAEIGIESAMKTAPPLDGATAGRVANELRQLIAIAASVVATSRVATSPHGDPS